MDKETRPISVGTLQREVNELRERLEVVEAQLKKQKETD